MHDQKQNLSFELFTKWVHDALNRLYDSAYLQTHPLGELLMGSESSQYQRSQEVRRVLLKSIRALRPEIGTPAQSPDWRAYRILELRYIEGLSPVEAMQQLACGRSQFFRDQARMLELLTSRLWEEWQPKINQESETKDQALQVGADPMLLSSREQLARSEIERMTAQATWETLNLGQLLDELRPLIETLALSKNCELDFPEVEGLFIAGADRVFVRQVILNLLTYAFDQIQASQLRISPLTNAQQIGLKVEVLARDVNKGSVRQGLGLELCREFMQVMQGSLQIEHHAHMWQARLLWPVASQSTMLLIDDNEGFADLFRRYLSGHPWQLVYCPDGTSARAFLSEQRPTLIMLDVMLPKEDGWEILISLKNDAATSSIPVVICSVLNEQDMARALGAQAYLSKPVTQRALLDLLQRWNGSELRSR